MSDAAKTKRSEAMAKKYKWWDGGSEEGKADTYEEAEQDLMRHMAHDKDGYTTCKSCDGNTTYYYESEADMDLDQYGGDYTPQITKIDETDSSWPKTMLEISELDIPEPTPYRDLAELLDPTTAKHVACDIAESVLHLYEAQYPSDYRVRNCINVKRMWLDGLVDDETLNSAIGDIK